MVELGEPRHCRWCGNEIWVHEMCGFWSRKAHIDKPKDNLDRNVVGCKDDRTPMQHEPLEPFEELVVKASATP